MVKHVILWTLKDEFDAEEKERIKREKMLETERKRLSLWQVRSRDLWTFA